MTDHTPTPWRVRPNPDLYGHYIVLEAYEKEVVAEEDEANAAFIERAVNAHDELMAAAKKMLEAWSDPDADQSAAIDALEAALAKAEGRT